MDPQVVDMEAFVTVAARGSFGRAAGALLVSQPTISDRIGRLERTVGAELFTRRARGVTLTPAGARFLPYATRILALTAEASHAARETARQQVRVGAHLAFSRRVLPWMIQALGPGNWWMTLRDAHSDTIVEMLLDRVLDVGFVIAGARPPQLTYVALRPEAVLCVCSPDHELARRRRVTLSTVVQHPVAFNRWGVDEIGMASLLEAPGAAARADCPDGATAIQLAAHQGFVAFVSDSAAAEQLTAGAVVKVAIRPALPWKVPLTLAFPEDTVDTEVLRRVLAAVPRAKVESADS